MNNVWSKKMKPGTRFILCLAAYSVLISSCKKEAPGNLPSEKPAFNFMVQSVLGDVKIIRTPGEKKAIPGDMLAINDIIITGKQSVADLTYGSSGIIRISEKSTLAITVIAGDASSESIIKLDKGKIFLTLGKLQNTGFKVRTPTVVASVRGTSFVVSADVVKGARLSVMKGTVTVLPVQKGEAIEGKEISVGAGQKMDYVSRNTVDRILQGRAEISVTPMTEAEIIEIKNTATGIMVDQIRDVDEEIRTEVKKDVIQADPGILRQQASDASGSQVTGSPVKVQNDALLKKNIESERLAAKQRRLEEEQKKREHEELLKKQAEEEDARARARREKASSIPTL
mgnify:CR=1 FL=1